MKKYSLFLITACCATLLLSSCSNMLECLGEAEKKVQVVDDGKVSYTIRHYKQNLENDNYTLLDSETETQKLKKMSMDSDVPKSLAKVYEGFHSDLRLNSSDNIVEIYYARNVTEYIFNSNGGVWAENQTQKTISGKYGSELSVPAAPEKDGFVLQGWALTAETETAAFAADASITVPANASTQTLYAVWKQMTAKAPVLTLVSGGEVTLSKGELTGGRIPFTAQPSVPGTYTYEWYFYSSQYGYIKQDGETSAVCKILIEGWPHDYYQVVVKAISSTGIIYTSNYQLILQ